MGRRCSLTIAAVATALGFFLPSSAVAQSTGLALTGQVRTPGNSPIVEAAIIVLGLDSRSTVRIHTNSKGEYNLYFSRRESGYRITATRIGFEPVTMLLQPREGERTRRADFVLQESTFELPTLLARSQPLTQLSPPASPGIGALDADALRRSSLAQNGGDLEELASLLPGVIRGDSGISVLGMSPAGNATLLNGTRFSGTHLPPDALATVRVATSSFDPSVGEFSGALTSVETRSGTDLRQAQLSARLSPSTLTWSDPNRLSPTASTVQLSGYASGPIILGRLHYFVAGQGQRARVSPLSLMSTRFDYADRFGLNADSLAALRGALRQAGIPLGEADLTADRTDLVGSLQFDARFSGTITARLLGLLQEQEQSGLGVGPLSFPTTARVNRQRSQRWAATLTSFQRGVVFETQLAVESQNTLTTGETKLPRGSVPLGMTDRSGIGIGTQYLGFGGPLGALGERSSLDLTARSTLQWTPPGSNHDLSLGVDWHRSTARRAVKDDPFGRYQFRDLESLGQNSPEGYTRELGGEQSTGSALAWAGWLGDVWTPTPHWKVEGGGRIDGILPGGSEPGLDPEIIRVFGLRDDLPRQLSLSPRIGFSWRSHVPQAGPDSTATQRATGSGLGGPLPVDRLGSLLELSELNLRPWVTVSGGYGIFRSRLSPQAEQIATLRRFTGTPGGATRLECFGSSVPVPNWGGLTDAPSACAGVGSVYSESSLPTIRHYGDDYQSPSRGSMNLSVTGLHLGGWTFGVNFIQARYTTEEMVDLNLRRTPVFTLATEAGRPVFSEPRGIDPASGLSSLVGSRRDPRYGYVHQISTLSGGSTTEFQAQLLPPRSIYSRIAASLNYVRSAQSTPMRGRSALADDPLSTSTFQVVRHQILLDAQVKLWWFRLTTQLEWLSGVPYTPQVVGDVNGDGVGGDQAFIPSLSEGSALAEEINTVLAHVPETAARCVRAQSGSIARIGSCAAPWRHRINLYVDFVPPRAVGLGSRLSLSVGVINAGAALQRLLGISPGQLTSDPPPDPHLLVLRGFDPADQRYIYHVNGGFGSPVGGAGRSQAYPTFGVQLRGEWRFGGPRRDRLVRDLSLRTESKEIEWTPTTALAHLRSLVSDPTVTVLDVADSLGLSRASRDSIVAIGTARRQLLDALLEPIARMMVSRQRHLVDADVTALLYGSQELIENVNSQAATQIDAVLTPVQREKLRLLILRQSTH